MITNVTWKSRWTFILAATGSAVGLGNIWKFPYITGEYGGGAFVLVYLGCILVIGIPVMIAEIMVGRSGRSDPSTA
jgi:NSS family neurotransmitter:Na+ symporter